MITWTLNEHMKLKIGRLEDLALVRECSNLNLCLDDIDVAVLISMYCWRNIHHTWNNFISMGLQQNANGYGNICVERVFCFQREKERHQVNRKCWHKQSQTVWRVRLMVILRLVLKPLSMFYAIQWIIIIVGRWLSENRWPKDVLGFHYMKHPTLI